MLRLFADLGFRWKIALPILLLAGLLAGCSSTGVNLGMSVPLGRHVGVGVSVGSDGRIGTGVGVSVGGGSVSVGTSGRLPAQDSTKETPAPR